ncbi:aldehyde dehydrogenase family protein [Roseiflexus castenholzii]|uniref:aldehyde dehydrogenase family protein n=1 Tax=Roseiflexus castenholzii TaxID=120962 RepID=UPI003C7AE93F
MALVSVRNPRTGQYDYQFLPPRRDELADVCHRLRDAQPAWEALGIDARVAVIDDWRRALAAHRSEIITALIADTGRYHESVLEFESVVSSIERWRRLAPDLLRYGESRSSALPFIRLEGRLVPYPLVGVISPWNFPLLLSLIDALPALLTGCAVLIKPSEIAPRFIEPLQRTIADVPALSDVLQYVAGDGATGAAMIDLVDLVCFTGSVPTGRRVAEAAAQRFIPAFLELGGKDPAIVLADADIERTAAAILWGGMVNAGQSCLSIERVYVEAPVFTSFVEALIDQARRLRLAFPEPQSGEIGPIISARQADVIADHLADAFAHGAVAPCGGALVEYGGGIYCLPTVLTNVNHTMKVMREETFAPILPVMPVADADEAVALANDSNFGLSAAVFSGNLAMARAIAARLHAGAISINDAALTALIHDGEKQSFKFSGLGGSRMGPAALHRFARKQALLVNTNSGYDPWWFQREAQ